LKQSNEDETSGKTSSNLDDDYRDDAGGNSKQNHIVQGENFASKF